MALKSVLKYNWNRQNGNNADTCEKIALNPIIIEVSILM